MREYSRAGARGERGEKRGVFCVVLFLWLPGRGEEAGSVTCTESRKKTGGGKAGGWGGR